MRRVVRPLVTACAIPTPPRPVSLTIRCHTSSNQTADATAGRVKDPRIQARPPGESADDFQSKFPLPDKEKEMELSKLQVHVSDLYKHGNYHKALSEAQRLLQDTTKHFGELHPATAAAHNNVGLLHKQLGQFDEARRSYRVAMKLYKQTVGSDHHSYASTLHNLGTLNRSQTHLDTSLKATDRLTLMDESAEVLETAYQIRRDELGEQHPHTVASRSSWGATLAAQILQSYKQVGKGQYVSTTSIVPELAWDVCEEHLRQALDTATSNPRGPSIGRKKRSKGQPSARKAKDSTSFSTSEKIETLSAASAAQNLAVFLKARATTESEDSIKLARLEEAQKLYTDSLTVRMQLLPKDHPDVYATKFSLAELLQAKGDEEAANAIRQEILDTYDPPAAHEPEGTNASDDSQNRNKDAIVTEKGMRDE